VSAAGLVGQSVFIWNLCTRGLCGTMEHLILLATLIVVSLPGDGEFVRRSYNVVANSFAANYAAN